MEIYWNVIVFVFGAIIGSFLNVVIYRLHTGKSLNGRSHCLTCGKSLSWYELFPIISYLVQRGKCRGCRAQVTPRYLVVELLTALSFLAIWNFFIGNIFLILVYAVLVSVFILIVVYDVRHTIIPDELTLSIGGIALVLLVYGYIQTPSVTFIVTHIGAGLGASLFFWGLWFVSKGRWIGFGDAKLAFPLGVIVGLESVFSMVVLSFWIGAGVSLTLLALERTLKRGKIHLHFLSTPLTIKSEVPFAPFLILGFLSVQFFHADIFNITYSLLFAP